MTFDISDLTCPITKSIMYDPVVAEDGIIYEHDAIVKWFSVNNTSPSMRTIMGSRLYRPLYVSVLVEKINLILEKNPELKEWQYVPSNIHADNIEVVNNRIVNCAFNDLLKYVHYDYTKLRVQDLLESSHNNVIKYVIDNVDDYHKVDNYDKSLIHHICSHATDEILIYYIEKLIGLSQFHVDNSINSPLFCIFTNEVLTLDGFKYFIQKYGLNAVTSRNERAIHRALYSGCSLDKIKYLVEDCNVDLHVVANNNIRPIHYACEYSSVSVVKYLVDKKVNLEVTDSSEKRPMHYACLHNNQTVIDFLIDKVDLTATFKSNGREIGIDQLIYQNTNLTDAIKDGSLRSCVWENR